MAKPNGWDRARFGATLRALINADGRADYAIARAAGCDDSYVGKLAKGKGPIPSIKLVYGLAAALNVSPARLLGLDLAPAAPEMLDVYAKTANALKEHAQRYGRYLTSAQQEEAIRLLVTAINALYDSQEITETLPIGAVCQVDPNAGCPQPSDRRDTPSPPRRRKKGGS